MKAASRWEGLPLGFFPLASGFVVGAGRWAGLCWPDHFEKQSGEEGDKKDLAHMIANVVHGIWVCGLVRPEYSGQCGVWVFVLLP